MVILAFIIYLISNLITIKYLKEKQSLTNLFLILLELPILCFPYFLGQLKNYELALSYLTGYTILSYFGIGIFQFLFLKKNLLKQLHRRFFYQICILVYLYILILFLIRRSYIQVTPPICFESILIMIFFFLFLFTMSFIPKTSLKKQVHSWLIPILNFIISLGMLYLISKFLRNHFFGIIVIYFPIYYVSFLLIQKENYQGYFLNIFMIMMLSLVSFSVADFIFMDIPIYSFTNLNTFFVLQTSIYLIAIFFIPLLIKLPKVFYYFLMFFLLGISFYLFGRLF